MLFGFPSTSFFSPIAQFLAWSNWGSLLTEFSPGEGVAVFGVIVG